MVINLSLRTYLSDVGNLSQGGLFMKRTPGQIPIVKNVAAAAMGNWKMILMAFLLVVGVIIGTLISRNPSSEQMSQLNGCLLYTSRCV